MASLRGPESQMFTAVFVSLVALLSFSLLIPPPRTRPNLRSSLPSPLAVPTPSPSAPLPPPPLGRARLGTRGELRLPACRARGGAGAGPSAGPRRRGAAGKWCPPPLGAAEPGPGDRHVNKLPVPAAPARRGSGRGRAGFAVLAAAAAAGRAGREPAAEAAAGAGGWRGRPGQEDGDVGGERARLGGGLGLQSAQVQREDRAAEAASGRGDGGLRGGDDGHRLHPGEGPRRGRAQRAAGGGAGAGAAAEEAERGRGRRRPGRGRGAGAPDRRRAGGSAMPGAEQERREGAERGRSPAARRRSQAGGPCASPTEPFGDSAGASPMLAWGRGTVRSPQSGRADLVLSSLVPRPAGPLSALQRLRERAP